MSDEKNPEEPEEVETEELGRDVLELDVSEEEMGGDIPLESFPEELPVLPLKNTVLFPFLVSPLLVNTPRSKELIDQVLLTPERLLVMTTVSRAVEGSPGADDVHRIGTVHRVVKMLKFQDGSYRLLVQGVARVLIEEYSSHEPFLRGRLRRLEEIGDPDSVEMAALMRNVVQEFVSLVSESPRLSDELQLVASNVEDPSNLADLIASNLEIDVAHKQTILEELNLVTRLNLVQAEIQRAHDAMRIETEIREKVQTDMGKSQREYMLRQQLDAIRRELGESEDEGTEVERLRERIEAAEMPEEAHKQATRELERLEQTPTASAEHGVIRNYLDWMTELPWSITSEDRLNVAEARAVLDEDHYDLEKVKDRIVEYIAVLSLKRDLRGPILCFVGPPGTGKTSLGRSIARAVGREFARVSLGGVRDEAEIRGHRRTYVGALPGRIVQALRKTETRNPVILLDEIDKVGNDYRGDPSSALLEVLDPEQNSTFSDHYLEVPFDLSQVLFIATANIMDPVPAALRDRMEVIELPGYTEEDKLEIAKRFLIPRQRTANGLDSVEFELPKESLQRIVQSYTREAGVRNLEREIGAVARKVARKVAEGESQGPFNVDAEQVEKMLGPKRYEPELADRAGRPGLPWVWLGRLSGGISCLSSPRVCREKESFV